MAFVYRAERHLDMSKKEGNPLGPGAYVGHKDYKVKPSQAPFSSQVTREAVTAAIKDPSQIKNYTPGPGSYQTSAGFEQINKNMTSAKNL